MQAHRSGWFKSSRSAQNGQCVEARYRDDGGLDVRDSKRDDGPVLSLGAHGWSSFDTAVKAGSFRAS